MVTHLHGWLLGVFSALALLMTAPPASAPADASHGKRTLGYGQVRYDGHGPEWWAARSRSWHDQALGLHRELQGLHRELLARPSVVEAINLACATYGFCSDLWRKARCETGGTFSPRSLNSSSGAVGLFQFLPSTFASTPYREFSLWSPYASALAAGWMHEHGRGGEWSCQ